MKKRVLLLIPLTVGAVALQSDAVARYRDRQADIDYINRAHRSALRARPEVYNYRPLNYAPREQYQDAPPVSAPEEGLTEERAYRFEREYAYRQSQAAMERALGRPDERRWTQARWRIKRTDGSTRQSYLTVDYGLDGHVVRRRFEW